MFTVSQKEEIMNMFKDMRVTDVRDGMDWIGYHHYGSMTLDMRPLWRTRAMGFASTSRYIPYDKPVPNLTGDEYTEWVKWYYGNICNCPWLREGILQKYDMGVVDASRMNVGLLGSANALGGIGKGISGYVVDGGFRDTDEVILEKIPAWTKSVAQTMDQGRIMLESYGQKINCGGVCVCQGDLVVADGDGVIVVPQDVVYDVGKWATMQMKKDKKGRRKMYLQLGLPLDDTVQVDEE